ncbi:MAG: class I SAM-dependent methyltransferase [Spirochaetia bacterium]|nr:class I SAM-dependent methyltransferase [Spirochaetia bacterium]
MEERKKKEVEFHNKREIDRHKLSEEEFQKKYSNKKFYSITRKSSGYFYKLMTDFCANKTALDYGCGLGGTSLRLAEAKAFVYGIDISDESVKTTKKLLKENGYEKKSKIQVMDGEKLKFKENSFDLIVCSGVLHHLDLNYAYPELSKILKPEGKIVCAEALGYNPIINLYRKRTLNLRTEWEADHILTLNDLKKAKTYFKKVNVRYFHLFTILAVPFRKTPIFNIILKTLEMIDSIVLKIPFVQLMAWQMIFVLSEPIKSGSKK